MLSISAQAGGPRPELLRDILRTLLLVSPFLLALLCVAGMKPVAAAPLGLIGAATLLLVPGYALLWTVRRDPFAPNVLLQESWLLVIAVSLALDVLLGVFLVLTPVGLSACSLWIGLSAGVLALGLLKVARFR